MNKSMLNKVLVYRVVGCVAWIFSTAIVAYLWTVLGQRGAEADAAGATGYATSFELMLGALAMPLAIVSVVLLHKANKIDSRYKTSLLVFQMSVTAAAVIYCIFMAFMTT
jgi:hypothetical protein